MSRRRDFVPSKNAKWLYQPIYQDAEGTTKIENIKTPQDLVNYLNALENNNVEHNNIWEPNNIARQVDYLQEDPLQQIVLASSIAHEEEVVQQNVPEHFFTENLIVHAEIPYKLSKSSPDKTNLTSIAH